MYQDDDEKDYNNLPNYSMVKDPVEEGNVLQEDNDNDDRPLGASQDVNKIPDSHLVDGNEVEANAAIEDASKES